MVSKLSEIISEIAEQYDIRIEGHDKVKIQTIERHLNENGNIEAAMAELDHVLGVPWKNYYAQIKKQLERR